MLEATEIASEKMKLEEVNQQRDESAKHDYRRCEMTENVKTYPEGARQQSSPAGLDIRMASIIDSTLLH